jgi:serine/threonine protein kinase
VSDGLVGGDGAAAEIVARLRNHLELHPDDTGAELQLGQLLFGLDERSAARAVLEALERELCAATTGTLVHVRCSARRLLAVLDEREGALGSAQRRWEWILADDIDDAEARNHLARLRPRSPAPTAALPLDTLSSPAGTTTTRYRLLRELGRGSTATVYLVRDERLDLPLALKVLHPQFASAANAQARRRFFTEARLAARVRHPGVVAIYDIDEASRSLAMEYIPGGTLRERIRRLHPAPASETLEIARSLLDTLAFVHAAGVIHGDLKPGNILCRSFDSVVKPVVEPEVQIVLADFGAAEIAPAPTELLHHASPVPRSAAVDERVGTPLYLAPEQFHGARPSTATDLFAVGMVLWELVAGRSARQQRDLIAGADAALPPLPRIDWVEHEKQGRQLSLVISALTAVQPASRPATASEALAQLLRTAG